MVISNTWIGLGRKIMDSDSVKRPFKQDVVAEFNFGWFPISESFIMVGGASLRVARTIFFVVV